MALKIETPAEPKDDVALQLNKPASAAPAKPAKEDKISLEGANQFIKGLIGGSRYEKAADEPKVEAPPAKPDEKPKKPDKAKEKPEAKPTPAKPFKPKPVPPTPALTPEQIASAAAEGATRALAAAKPKGEDDKPKGPELSPQDQRKVEILTRMEVLNPERYKGVSAKYTESITKLEKYAKDWQKEHPGQEFDEESPEHEDFFKANDVDWSDEDYTEALADIRAEKRMAEADNKTKDRLDSIERQETLRQKAGEITTEQNTAAHHFWRELAEQTGTEDLASLLNADGTLNMEKANALKASDPDAFRIHVQAAQSLDAEVAEIWKLYHGLEKNDPQNNPVHRAINQFATAKEKELAGKPVQERMNAEGKVFVPAAQFYRMNKAEREQHWTFSGQDLAFLRASELASVARKQSEIAEAQHIAWAKARGIQLEKPDGKPESPSSGGESRMAAVAGGESQTVAPVTKQFLDGFNGR